MTSGSADSDSTRQAREALGGRLRDVRRSAGLTGRTLAMATGQHFTRVSKIEHGVKLPTEADVRAWCEACGAVDQIPDLVASLRSVQSAYLEHQRQSKAGMRRVLGAHTLELYEHTRLFRIFEHNVIPGLFQTEAYTRAMLEFWVAFLETPNDIDAALAVRVQRQQVLYRAGKHFAVVLEEQALRTWFGTAQTQAEQLDRLLRMMSLPSVSLSVIPLAVERTGVASAGFWIFDDSLVALETPTAGIEVTRPAEITLYARMFDHLNAAAVHGAAARALIAKAAAELP